MIPGKWWDQNKVTTDDMETKDCERADGVRDDRLYGRDGVVCVDAGCSG